MPIEKESVSKTAGMLHTRCGNAYLDETGERWQRDTARDLNLLLGHAQQGLRVNPSKSDEDFARAVLRVVERVAEFEGIRRVGK